MTGAYRVALVGLTLLLPSVVNAQLPRIRDSAGVRIVENAARATAGIAFRVGEYAVLDLGGLKSSLDDEFTVNAGNLRAVRLRGGRLVVLDEAKIRYYDRRGNAAKVVGRKGQGPGDFMQPGAVCGSRGDSLVVSDPFNGRTTVLDAAGAMVKQVSTGIAEMPWDNGCFDDGTWLTAEIFGDEAFGRALRLVRRRLNGSLVGVPWNIPGGTNDFYLPIRPTITVFGSEVIVGDPRSSEVRFYGADGKLRRIVRTDDPLERVSELARQSMKPAFYVRGGSDPKYLARERERIRTTAKPQEWPSYGRIAVDPDGRLWIQDYQKDRPSPDVWTGFDREGRMLGRVSMPAQTRAGAPVIQQFTAGGVMIRRQDSDGAEHLTIYPLLPVPGTNRGPKQ